MIKKNSFLEFAMCKMQILLILEKLFMEEQKRR